MSNPPDRYTNCRGCGVTLGPFMRIEDTVDGLCSYGNGVLQGCYGSFVEFAAGRGVEVRRMQPGFTHPMVRWESDQVKVEWDAWFEAGMPHTAIGLNAIAPPPDW